MTQGKGTYSLISVDVAPDEEVVRVDANGVHREGGTHAATDSSQRASALSNDDGQQALEGRSSSEAGMQRIIIVAVVVCLIAFIVYFAVSHG